MKKITKSIIAVFAIATMLTSCSKDDKVSNDPTGNWTMDNAVVSTPNKTPETIDVDGDCPVHNYINLKTGGTLEEGDVDADTCELTTGIGTWTKTNNSLELKYTESDKVTFNIQSVTGNKLVLRMTDLGSDVPAGSYIDFNFSKK